MPLRPAIRFAIVVTATLATATLAPGPSAQPSRVTGAARSVTITALAQDLDGFLWVGTPFGLSRFDGHRAVHYGPSAGDDVALVDPFVNVGALAVARDGAVWVGTAGGLCRIPTDRTRADCLTHDSSDPTSLPSDEILAVSLGDDLVWVGTSDGVATVDPTTLDVRRMASPAEAARAVQSYRDGAFVGTATGLFWVSLDTSARRIAPMPALVTALALADGALWVGTFGSGLYTAAPHRPGVLSRVESSLAPSWQGSGSDHILTLSHDPVARRLLVGSMGAGLLATGTRRPFLDRSPLDPGRPTATTAIPAAGGGYWLGSWDGLYRTEPSGPYLSIDFSWGLQDRAVQAIWAQSDDVLWIGTAGEGLWRCRLRRRTCSAYRSSAADPTSLPNDDVTDLLIIGDKLWATTFGGGLWRLDLQTGATDRPPGGGRYAYALAADGTRLLVASADQGLDAVLGPVAEGRTISLLPFGHVGQVLDVDVFDGVPWAATQGSGLCRPARHAPRCIREAPGSLASDLVLALATVGSGLWVGSVGGIDRLDSDGHLRPLLRSDRWAHPQVTCLVPTERGVWTATGSGLLLLDRRTGGILVDGIAAGLPSTTGGVGGCARVGRRVAFGTDRGVIVVDPDRLRSTPSAAHVVGATVDGRARLLSTAADLVLGPADGGPRFDVAAPALALDRRRYSFRLAGYERSWSAPSPQSSVTYPKLPPGRYAFEVRTAPAGVKSPVISLAVIVRPPWWRTPWAIALAALVAGGLAWAAHRLRLRAVLRVEHTRRQIADDLHDEMGGRLSGLALALDIASRTLPVDARAEVRSRSDEARDILGDLRDTVWVVDAGRTTVADLAERIRQTAEGLAPQVDVSLRLEGASDTPLSMDTRRHALFVCKEALHNAVRHGRPRHLHILVDGTGPLWRILIDDDGVGVHPASTEGHGSGSMRRRAAALGGAVTVEPRPGGGTRVSLTFQA
ncbi:triple tyrosine motif-containing protein [Rubrivirga sp. IMCC43871]|uniref:sensor histidine kinase n=1 Tax=Rubrivirga sp. IMCC43871 TaxID=3391575 RepID=UPI00398FF985